MKDQLGSVITRFRKDRVLYPVFWMVLLAMTLVVTAIVMRSGMISQWGGAPLIGHVTRAFGTVKLSSTLEKHAASRLETGKAILAPLHLGDQIQTGEESAAQILFFGGSTFQLETASLAHFEDNGEEIAIRLILGRGYFEFPANAQPQNQFVFRKADGSLAEVPAGKKLVLTLSAVQRLEDAVEVKVVDADESPEGIANLELKHLAQGEVVANRYPLIVQPITEKGREPAANWRKPWKDRAAAPAPRFPSNESYVDTEANEKIAFKWNKIERSKKNPVIAYEVVVRPAFDYEVPDVVRKTQVFRGRGQAMRIDTIGGSGVFLWSVRAVTADGERGPASAPRWLEIKFPKELMAPTLRKPKID